jgi:predicted component of type VI protein secretion system
VAEVRIVVVEGPDAGQEFDLSGATTIGRDPSAGIVIDDAEASRRHASLSVEGSTVTVEDLGSTNGTFVNGARIAGAQALRAGDQVRVGQTTMSVEGGAAEGATTVGQVIPPAAAATPPPPAAVAATPPTQPFQPAQPPQGPPPGAPQPGYAGGPIGGPPQASTGGGGSKAPWIALAAVVLIALIVGGLAIGGVFSSDKKNNTASTTPTTPAATTPAPAATTPATPPPTAAMPAPPPTPSAPSSGGGYPPGFVSKLIASCNRGGKLTPSQCSCWFHKLANAYTFPQLVQVIRKAQGGSIPPKAVSLLRTCLAQ